MHILKFVEPVSQPLKPQDVQKNPKTKQKNCFSILATKNPQTIINRYLLIIPFSLFIFL